MAPLMRSLASRAVALAGGWVVGACSSQSNPPLLRDCLDPSCLMTTNVPAASPAATNMPTIAADAGAVAALPDAGTVLTTIPEAGPGPGIGPSTGGAGSAVGGATEPGFVCPASAPTNGAPCDAVANSGACAYANLTCFCTTNWVCF